MMTLQLHIASTFVSNGSGGGIPENALLDENGDPLTDENGEILLFTEEV